MRSSSDFIFFILFYLRLLLHLISLGVLIFWFMKSRKRTLDGVLLTVGILLHLYALFFAFGTILKLDVVRHLLERVIFSRGSKWVNWHFYTFVLLYCFKVWLGLTLILKHKELQWKRFLGILPLISVLMALAEPFIYGSPLYYPLLLPIIVAVVMIIFHVYSKRSTAVLKAPEEPGIGREAPKQIEPEPARPIQQPANNYLPCRKTILTLNSSDMSKLKEHGPEFSSKLLGKVIAFKDRISFQGLLIAVTHLEPVGPAVVTSETRIKIRGTEDPVILNCPLCGTIQEETRKTCSNCSAQLPVKIL